MLITTILTFFVIRYRWHYRCRCASVATGFFLIDRHHAVLVANTLKIAARRLVPAAARRHACSP